MIVDNAFSRNEADKMIENTIDKLYKITDKFTGFITHFTKYKISRSLANLEYDEIK